VTLTLDVAIDRAAAPEHVRERLHARPRSTLRRSVIIVYATLFGCALTTPRPLLQRLRTAELGPATDFAERMLTPLERLAERSATQSRFDSTRSRFLDGPAPPSEIYRLRAAFDD
jgi:hypothetical protein